MQADVILKEPPPWMPPLSLSGGARVEGGGGARPPPLVRPCIEAVLTINCSMHTRVVHQLFGGWVLIWKLSSWLDQFL